MREYHKMLKGARSVLGVLVIFGRPLGSALRTDQRMQSRGFSLIELMIVTVIVGLLAGLALPQFDAVRERAFDSATIAELNSAVDELERYFVEHFEYPSSEDDLFADGFALSPDISFLKFSRSGARTPRSPAFTCTSRTRGRPTTSTTTIREGSRKSPSYAGSSAPARRTSATGCQDASAFGKNILSYGPSRLWPELQLAQRIPSYAAAPHSHIHSARDFVLASLKILHLQRTHDFGVLPQELRVQRHSAHLKRLLWRVKRFQLGIRTDGTARRLPNIQPNENGHYEKHRQDPLWRTD